MKSLRYFWAMLTLTKEKRELIDRWNHTVILSKTQDYFPLVNYDQHSYIKEVPEYNVIEYLIDGRTYKMAVEFIKHFSTRMV